MRAREIIKASQRRDQVTDELRQALQDNDLELIGLAIEYGADPNQLDEFSHSLWHDYWSGIIQYPALKALLEAGANPNVGLCDGLSITSVRDGLRDAGCVSGDVAALLSSHGAASYCPPPRFVPSFQRGQRASNPIAQNDPFYLWAVAVAAPPYLMRESVSGKQVGDYPLTWTFRRFGMSASVLGNGTVVFIAGEHEDYYDSDFVIFNDVIVVRGGRAPEVYFYQEKNFPPTDFHSATVVEKRIWIIGNLGYPESRRSGSTQVLSLNQKDWSITQHKTNGNNPGWVFGHRAAFDSVTKQIIVWSGKTYADGQVSPNYDVFAFEPQTLRWTCLGSLAHHLRD